MPIIKPERLKGLKGLSSLSTEEYDAFVDKNKSLISQHNYDPVYINNLYNNKQFIDKFGIEQFKAMPDINMRNDYYRKGVVYDAMQEYYGKDADFNLLATQLDVQGMEDLLNSDYMGTQERQKKLKAGIKAAKNVVKDYDIAMNNPYTDVLGAGYMSFGKASAAMTPYDQDNEYATKDKEIRERLFAETQERRESEVAGLSGELYASMLTQDKNKQKSLAQQYDEFDKLATEKSYHYAQFKNTEWLKNYSNEDRLKDYAQYQALESAYGKSIADLYLERNMQNRIAEAQDGKFTGNTLRKVANTIWSDLGSNVALFSHVGDLLDSDKMAIWNMGKDPNKPIYDVDGTLMGYEDNAQWWSDPAYWNDVYKYNTPFTDEIKTIKERGGVSPYVNVREYGHVPEFLTWETAQEAFAQSGHFVAPIIETALTAGLTKGAGAVLGRGLKALGTSANAMAKLSKAGKVTNDLLVAATSGLEGAQLEAMGTFEEQMDAFKERKQQQIQQELREYLSTVDYSSPEAQKAIKFNYQTLKELDRERVASVNYKEGRHVAIPQSDEVLLSQAKQQYTKELLEAKNKELEILHQADDIEAAKAAAKAYGVNFFLDWAKNVPLTTGIQKFKIAKGAMKGAFDNTISSNMLADAVTGGVKKKASQTSATKLAIELGKQLGGGFTDEYLDGVNASFASGVGDNEFNNYMYRSYNPELYNAAAEGMLGNLISGLNSGVEGTSEWGNIYEGLIGMVSPFASVSVNVNAAFSPKDVWKAVVQGTDARGNQLNFAERLSTVLMNPLLDTYSSLKQKDRDIDFSVKVINDIVAANKDKLNDASKIMSAVNDFSSPVVKLHIGEGEASPSLIDSKDAKLYNAFTLLDALNSLEHIEGGTQAALYQDVMHTLEGLSEGTLSDVELQNEIDMFLADEDNKSILGTPNGREVAQERLQKNAQYLMSKKQQLDNIYGMFAQSPDMKEVDPRVRTILAYNLLAEDDYRERLNEIEEDLGSSHTDTESLYIPDYGLLYGTQKAREQAVAARERLLKDLQKQLTEVQENKDKAKEEDLKASYAFQEQTLKEQEQQLLEEKEVLSALANGTEGESVLTEAAIMGADARDRADVLNPANRGRYSKKQQKIIEHVEKKLSKQEGALQKIQDAGVLASRISSINTTYNRLRDNHRLASVYLNAAEQLRTQAAMAESLQEGIDERYSVIEKAYINRFEKKPRNVEKRQQEFRDAVMSSSSAVVDAYMEDHPEQQGAVRPYYDLLKWEDDAAAVIVNADIDDSDKLVQLSLIRNAAKNANSREDAQKNIEAAIDNPETSEYVRKAYDTILTAMDQLGYHRDATVIESRNERKVREEAQKKAEEERKAKLEAETKAAAEEGKKKAEEKKKEIENKGEVETVQSEGNILKALNEGEEVGLGGEGTAENKEDAQQKAESSVTSSVMKVSDGNMQAKSPTVEEQLSEMEDTSNVEVSYDFVDVDNQNQQVEKPIDSSVTTLNGVAEGEWVIDKDAENKRNEKYNNPNRYDKDLAHDHVLVHKEGNNDSMSKYFAWMDNEGIKLQNIIDDEFSQYVAKNPHTKLKFMRVRPDHNATNDYDMISRLMLVIDYDEAINKGITAQHKEDNGGVIISDGKKYLVVGTVGYGNEEKNPDKFKAWKVLMDSHGKFQLKETAAHWFKNHPLERFYVHPTLETEVVPGSMIPGYLVKQEGEARRITDILDKSEMNPHNLKLEKLAWGIQQLRDYVTVNSDRSVMVPQNRVENAGRAFVLIPAGNGKLLSAYIEPLQWNDEKFNKDSELALKIDGQFRKLVSPDYKNRLEAVSELGRIFYFSDKENEGDTILIGTDKVPVVTIKKGNQKLDSIDLSKTDGSSAYERLLNAITNQNPRINVTLASLQNADRLLELDEAGALMTDLAKLGTAGVSYSIYSINEAGEMEVPDTPVQMITMKETDSSYSDANRLQVPYTKGNFYDYDKNTQKFYLRGKEVTDVATIEELQYAIKINSLTPNRQKGIWSYYILDADKSEVVKQSSKTKKIERLSEEDAKAFIDQFNQEEETKRREQEMKRLIDEQEGKVVPVMDEETGTLNFEETATEEEKKEKEGKEGEEGMTPDNGTVGNPQSYTYQPTSKTQTLKATIRQGGENKMALDRLLASDDIRAKWPDMPIGILAGRAVYQTSELIRFLEEKGIPVTAIGTSAEDFEAWLHLIECV